MEKSESGYQANVGHMKNGYGVIQTKKEKKRWITDIGISVK